MGFCHYVTYCGRVPVAGANFGGWGDFSGSFSAVHRGSNDVPEGGATLALLACALGVLGFRPSLCPEGVVQQLGISWLESSIPLPSVLRLEAGLCLSGNQGKPDSPGGHGEQGSNHSLGPSSGIVPPHAMQTGVGVSGRSTTLRRWTRKDTQPAAHRPTLWFDPYSVGSEWVRLRGSLRCRNGAGAIGLSQT